MGYVINARFRVDGLINVGANGEVYEVFDLHRGETYALKLLAGAVHGPPWHEAQVLTQLRGEYILPVHNADWLGAQQFLVTELAHHGTAANHLQPIGIDPERAVRWVQAACRGAARTHADHLLHRDIKPENMFITDHDEVLLGDFGLAQLVGPPGIGTAAGTAYTMAPEVFTTGQTSVRSDVYSLGASLYGLVAGQYAHAPGPACPAAVVAGPGTLLAAAAPHVSVGLARIVAKAMDRNPAARFSNPDEFDAALGRLVIPARTWVRTDEHGPPHAGCWRGSRQGHAEILVCAVFAGPRFDVETRHDPSGTRLSAGCLTRVPPSGIASAVRRAIRAVS